MESLQTLKIRSRAVRNVGQITRAMEVVAATKMRKAQEIALNSRPYAFEALSLLEKLSRSGNAVSLLTDSRKVKKTLLVLIASDKGLTGSFNAQVFRAADGFFANDALAADKSKHETLIFPIGKKSMRYAVRNGHQVVGSIYGAGDYAEVSEVDPLAKLIVSGFTEKKWDRVVIISTHFRTALMQETLLRFILPVDFKKIRNTVSEIIPEKGRYAHIHSYEKSIGDSKTDYMFEPSLDIVFDSLVTHLVKMQIYHLVLEANASEHSARRAAMKTASDNADDLIKSLTLEYNKARQASITKEIIEITSTQAAL